MYEDSTIFIQIASYRDKELRPTIESLLKTCRFPNTLHICICHQHHPKDEWDHLDEYKDDQEIYRHDYTEEEIAQYTNGNLVNIWIDTILVYRPAEWIVWPNNGEWLERMSGTL